MNSPPDNHFIFLASLPNRMNFDFNLAAPARGPATGLAYIE
jgi:hypothetical protein